MIDVALPFDKQDKDVHRYEIVDARGRLRLTVPLSKPHSFTGKPTWNDTRVSTHDEWWCKHRTALESAYGRTPYFEFIFDRFSNIFRSPEKWPDGAPSALDVIREANSAVCEVLMIDTPVEYGAPEDMYQKYSQATIIDLRDANFKNPSMPPYWQVRRAIHGFQSDLSILDLIFNLGPEGAIYLRAGS